MSKFFRWLASLFSKPAHPFELLSDEFMAETWGGDPVSVALIGAAGAVGGAAIGARGARQAAQTQSDAANEANRLQWDMYMQNRQDLAPWREAGAGVLPQLTAGLAEGGKFNRDFSMEDFQKDPGYDFRLQEGMKALDRSAARRGNLYGGAGAKALARYAQDYASGEYTNAFNRYMAQRDAQFNRLSGLAGTGQTASNQTANYGMNAATNVGNNIIGAGNARASGYVGQANAINSAIGPLTSAWQQYMNQSSPASYGGQPWGGSPSDPWYG